MGKKYDRATPQERAVREALKEAGIKVNTTKKFSYKNYQGKTKYIKPDISLPEIKLCLEIDGGDHETEKGKAKDKKRDATIREHGWQVVHIPNDIVNHYKKFDKLIDGLVEQVKKARESTEKGKKGHCRNCNKKIAYRYTYCRHCNEARQAIRDQAAIEQTKGDFDSHIDTQAMIGQGMENMGKKKKKKTSFKQYCRWTTLICCLGIAIFCLLQHLGWGLLVTAIFVFAYFTLPDHTFPMAMICLCISIPLILLWSLYAWALEYSLERWTVRTLIFLSPLLFIACSSYFLKWFKRD